MLKNMADNCLAKSMFLSETVKQLHDLFTGILKERNDPAGHQGLGAVTELVNATSFICKTDHVDLWIVSKHEQI